MKSDLMLKILGAMFFAGLALFAFKQDASAVVCSAGVYHCGTTVGGDCLNVDPQGESVPCIWSTGSQSCHPLQGSPCKSYLGQCEAQTSGCKPTGGGPEPDCSGSSAGS